MRADNGMRNGQGWRALRKKRSYYSSMINTSAFKDTESPVFGAGTSDFQKIKDHDLDLQKMNTCLERRNHYFAKRH